MRNICRLFPVCLLLIALLSACGLDDVPEMTAVPIGTEMTETVETAAPTETAEATEGQKYQPAQATEPSLTPATAVTEAVTETDLTPLDTKAVTELTPATEAPTEPFVDRYGLAKLCIGCGVADLYTLIGYPPNGSSYTVRSNTDPNNVIEDGQLYYDGFTVYTVRENGEEFVLRIEP